MINAVNLVFINFNEHLQRPSISDRSRPAGHALAHRAFSGFHQLNQIR